MVKVRGSRIALLALVAVSAGLRFWAAAGIPTPWIVPDEVLYALLGRSLWEHGTLSVLGGPTPYYSAVYPALAGLPLSLGSVHAGYTALKAVQAVAMSLAAVPVYLWGRSLMRPGWALGAAALTLALPGLAYTGMVMTEVAFYPLLVVCAWAAARAFAEPTPRRQAALLGACALLVATRLQAVVLVAALPTAAVLEALLARRPARLVRLWPLAVVAAAGLAFLAVRGGAGLGGYAAAAGSYDAGAAARYVLYHAGALVLLCGVAPACAVALLVVRAARDPEPAPVRAYLSVTAAFCLWIVVEVGVFASEHAGRIEERDLLGLAPLLFLGFALWLERGAQRAYLPAALVALAAAALVLLLPFPRFVTDAGVPDSPTFAAAVRAGGDPLLLLGIPAAAVAAGFVLLPRRLLPGLAALLLAGFAAGSVAASAEFRDRARLARDSRLGADARWIDRAASGPVGALYGGGNFTPVWASLFWNERIARVYHLPGRPVPGPVPQHEVDPGPDGGIPVRERLLVTAEALVPLGREVATEALPASDAGALVLRRLHPPPRLSYATAGFAPNGDVASRALVNAWDCNGSFALTLLGKTDERVQVWLDGAPLRTYALTEGRSRFVVVPVSKPGQACLLQLVTSSLVGVTTLSVNRG